MVRRVVIAGLATSAALMVASAAQANQGTNNFQPSANDLSGTRVSVHRNLLSPGSNGGVNINLRVQKCNCAGTGLVQIGYGINGSSYSDDCGANHSVAVFVEYFTGGGLPHCTTYSSSTSQDQRMGLVRRQSGGYWGAYLDSTLLSPIAYTGFNFGVAKAGGEWSGSSFGTADGCWGCYGFLAWQYSEISARAIPTSVAAHIR